MIDRYVTDESPVGLIENNHEATLFERLVECATCMEGRELHPQLNQPEKSEAQGASKVNLSRRKLTTKRNAKRRIGKNRKASTRKK